MSTELDVLGVGRMAYGAALELQRALARARIDRTLERDLLILVEHPPVITLGRSTQRHHLLTPEAELRARGVELFDIERGGDVTFHGPGQLVGYPIYDLTEHKEDLHYFLRQLEEAIIRALDHLGIAGGRRDKLTGVWVDNRKIASIGIHVKKWVTWHGFALNVLTDLSYFDLIVPCGITGVEMTTIQRELGAQAPRDLWGLTCDYVTMEMAEVFGQRPQAAVLGDVMERLERVDS